MSEYDDKLWLQRGVTLKKIDSRNTVWPNNDNGFDDMSKPCPFSAARFVCPESQCKSQRACVWGYEG